MVPLIPQGCDEVGIGCHLTGNPWAILIPILIQELRAPKGEGRDAGRGELQSMQVNLSPAVTALHGSVLTCVKPRC